MIIYRGSDVILEVQSDGIEYGNINTHEHTISFTFELADKVNFEKGDSVFLDKKFSLYKDCVPVINKLTNGFVYNLTFYDEVELWANFIVKYDGDTDFDLTTSGTNHLKLISDNISSSIGGDIPYLGVNDIKNVVYKDLNILEALDLVAEIYGLEWWFDGALHLGALEINVDNPTKLEYDVELDDISFSESSEAKITRLYAFGGSRNMPYNKRLKLDAPIDAFQGLDLLPLKVIEGVRYFDDIYPRQQDTISAVTSHVLPAGGEEQQDTTIYQFSSASGLVITEDDLLSDEIFKVSFEDGELAGREFNIIIKGDNLYEIEYIQEGENYTPNPSLSPKVGDKFVFFGFNAEVVMGDLIANAKEELEIRAKNYLKDLGGEYIYEVSTRSINCELNNVNLELGQSVKLISPVFGEVVSRVQSYEKHINNPYEATYVIGNSPAYSRIGVIEQTVEANRYQMNKSVGLTAEYVKYLINTIGLREFLSKTKQDTAQGRITFKDGVNYGDYSSGLIAGKGGRIDERGNAELESARIRSLLEVPEIRFNKTSFVGDETFLTEYGIIETVEKVQGKKYRAYLKLVDGEHIEFVKDDLLKGIFHDFEAGYSGFAVSCTIVDFVGSDYIDVILVEDSATPSGYNLPPLNSMRISRVGNATIKERQRYVVLSSKKGGMQIYDGAVDFLSATVVGSFDTSQDFQHKFDNLPLQEGLPYAYLAGLVVQDIIRVDYEGVHVREIYDRGKWVQGRVYYNNDEKGTDDVWHIGCRWRCFSSSTTAEPSWTSAEWIMIEGRSDARMEFDSSNGLAFFSGMVDTVITPILLIGNTNVSDEVSSWVWKRESGDVVSDDVWNTENVNNRLLNLSNEDMGTNWSRSNPVKFKCTATYSASNINEITNYIEI